MQQTSDKDSTPAATAQQIASTNSTANAFLGGNHTRPWMSGAASDTASPARQIQVAASKSNKPSSAVLPSPASSNEPSPVQTNQGCRVIEEERVAPSTQQPLPTFPQVNTASESLATQGPPTRAVVHEQYSVPVQAPVPSAKRRKMSSANFPSLKAFLPIVKQYIQSCRGGQPFSTNVEKERFSLIQSACYNNDYFYVALHQILCLWYLDPEEATRLTIPSGERVLQTSLTIVCQLIGGTSGVSVAHTKWFSEFPNSLAELTHRSDQYQRTVSDVCSFLVKLSSDWSTYRSQCLQRGYPPLVDELVNRFGLHSPIFQRVFFTATRRNLGMPEDEYSARMEQLFVQDQESHRQIAARYNTAYPPTEREITQRNNWQANKYITLRHFQQSQCVPTLGSNPPQSVQSPNTVPSVTHPRQPDTIRAEVRPSGLLSPSPQSATTRNQYPMSQLPSGPLLAPPQGPPNVSAFVHPSQSPLPTYIQWPSQAFGSHHVHTVAEPTTRNQLEQPQNVWHIQDQRNSHVQAYSRSPYSSHNQQSANFHQTVRVASSPMQPNPLRNNSLNNTIPTIANMSPGQSRNQPQHQQLNGIPFIPPADFVPTYQLPQPERNALHQSHLRSPTLSPADLDGGQAMEGPIAKYYQAVRSFAVEPTVLSDRLMVSEFLFTVPKSIFHNIAEDKISSPSAPPHRKVRQGSLQYRVRCCQIKKGRKDFGAQEFVVADTFWPPTLFMDINGSVLEIRRKHHHGKDLPVDITSHVFSHGPDNENTIRISIPLSPKKQKGVSYVVAVEAVEVFRHQQILDMCLNGQRIIAEETIKDIKAKLSSNKDDDDVSLVCTDLTIDLADPFTARIFSTPVRGTHCLHRECFDLETFLTTRNSKSGRQEDPCMADVWKCPLCGRDARPLSLRIDDFLVSVREKLERKGELEVKAISVGADGSWKVRLEALPATKVKSRKRSTSKIDGEDMDNATMNSRQGSRPTEIIEVDDD